MKFSLFYIFLIALTFQECISSPLKAQDVQHRRISISLQNMDLETALKKIAAKAEVRFVYNNKVWKEPISVNIQSNEEVLKEVLDKLLLPNGINYEVINNQFIVLKRDKGAIPLTENQSFGEHFDVPLNLKQGFVISGNIKDEAGLPLPGVTVKVREGSQAVSTNAKGNFAIGVNRPNSTLDFSFIGYKSISRLVSNAELLQITMQADPGKLDEVVIIGYGTTTRRTSTGSQGGISAKEIQNQPVTNVLQAAAAQMAGVLVTQSNGLPGANISVQVRGLNSIGKNNVPLYVIDGVPYMQTPINAATSGAVLPSAEGNTSPLNSINPADIESMEVLKDADATAIYGSRGANGVVLITTKKGKDGLTNVGLNLTTGVSKVTNTVPLLGTERYLEIRRQAFLNDKITPTIQNAPDLLVWDQNAYTDFQDLLLGNTARSNDANLNISGGSQSTNFYLSGSFHKESNIYPGAQGYRRASANASINHSSLDNRFSLSFSTIYSADKNNISTTDLASQAYNMVPNFPLYNADGSLYWAQGIANPLGYLNQTNDNKTTNLLSSLSLKYTILKGLDLKSTFGYSKTDMDQYTVRPLSSYNPFPLYGTPPTSGTVSNTYNFTNNYIIEPQVTYSRKLWVGDLNVLGGGTWQYRQSKMPYSISATDFASDDFLYNIAAASTRNVSSASADYKYTSVFGRINYNVANKYIFNFNFRRDGSSRFGPDNRFGNFGSAAVAWVFSEEKFLKDKLSWFSFGKLRGSYGVVGNDEIGNYQYLDSYRVSTYIYNGTTGLVPSRIANNAYKWENTHKFDAALELGFLKDRINIITSYYRNRTGNQLLNYGISAQAGFSSYQANLPAVVQNSGIELEIRTTNIRNKDFNWTSSFNISQNRNEIQSFPGIEKSSYYSQYQVGRPMSGYYSYQFTGVDPTTGLPTYTDFNNSGTITGGFAETGRGDRYYAGTGYPKYYGGLTNNITYKDFALGFTFQFTKQQGRSLLAASYYPPGFMYNAAASFVEDYLALSSMEKLASTTYATAYTAYSNYSLSDRAIVDASFIRLRNVNFSYNLPKSLLNKASIKNVRVFLQGQNLFTITSYKGYDPESQGVVTPPLRTFVAGVQCLF